MSNHNTISKRSCGFNGRPRPSAEADNAEYATTIGVRALPTLYFIQDGELKYKMEGVVSAETLEEMAEHFFYGMILQRPVHLTFKRRLF
jgi:hypothetical protein